MLHEQLQLLLNKPMDRREFLKMGLRLCLLLTGVGALTRGLLTLNSSSPPTKQHSLLDLTGHSFGSNKFGV